MTDYGLGCLIDPAVTAEFEERLAAEGFASGFGDARPELSGYGIGRSAFDFDAEHALFGKHLPAWHQSVYPVCVSQGTGRAIQSSLYWSLVFGGLIGSPVEIAAEPIYGARNMYHRMTGGGMYGADAARYVHDCGVVSRQKYGSTDLSKQNPQLGNNLGQRGAGVPASVLAASKEHKVPQCFRARSIEDVRDATAAGYFGSFCSGYLWQHQSGATQRNVDGMCRPVGRGGHCIQVCGTFEDRRGDLIIVVRNSWGQTPVGGGPFKLKDGSEVQPPIGAHGVYPDDFNAGLRSGECWHFAPPDSGFRTAGTKPSDLEVA